MLQTKLHFFCCPLYCTLTLRTLANVDSCPFGLNPVEAVLKCLPVKTIFSGGREWYLENHGSWPNTLTRSRISESSLIDLEVFRFFRLFAPPNLAFFCRRVLVFFILSFSEVEFFRGHGYNLLN